MHPAELEHASENLTITLCTDTNWTVDGNRWHVAFHDGTVGYLKISNSSTEGDKVTLDLGSSGHVGTIYQGYSSVASTILWDTPPPTVGGLWHFSPGALPFSVGDAARVPASWAARATRSR